MDIDDQIRKLASTLRPHARQGKAFYAELRALRNQYGQVMKDEIEAYKRRNGTGHGVKMWQIVTVILRYRLSLFAGFEILEDVGALKVGTYDRIKESKDVEGKQWRPSHILRQVILQHGIPEPAYDLEMK